MKNIKIKKYIMFGILGALTLSSILMTIEGAASGAEVSSLQRQEMVLADQKRVLENSLVKTLSVSKLEEKGLELGFSKPAELVYVAPAQAVAKLP